MRVRSVVCCARGLSRAAIIIVRDSGMFVSIYTQSDIHVVNSVCPRRGGVSPLHDHNCTTLYSSCASYHHVTNGVRLQFV